MRSIRSIARRMSCGAECPARLFRMMEHVTEFGRIPCSAMSPTRAHIPLRSFTPTNAFNISLYVTWLALMPAALISSSIARAFASCPPRRCAFRSVLYDTTSTRPWDFISAKCDSAAPTLPHCTQESRSALYTSGVIGAPEAWRFRNTCVAPSRSWSFDFARIIATCFATSTTFSVFSSFSVSDSAFSSARHDNYHNNHHHNYHHHNTHHHNYHHHDYHHHNYLHHNYHHHNYHHHNNNHHHNHHHNYHHNN